MKKLTRTHILGAFLILLAIAAVLALTGHPLLAHLPPEVLAGLGAAGAVPMAAGEVTMQDVKSLIQAQGTQIDDFVKRHQSEMAEVRRELDGIKQEEIRLNRVAAFGGFSHGAKGRAMTTEEKQAFDGALRALMVGNKEKADDLFLQAKAMNAGTGPDGGYMVHTQFSAGFTKVMAEISPIYRLARVIPLDAGVDSFEEPIDRDTADAVWTGEQSARAETDTPQLGLFRLDLKEIYAMPKVTQKLVDLGSFDVLAWLQTKVGEAFGTKESAAFHTGDGVARPRGFLTHDIATTADATRAWGTVQYIPSGASGAFATASTTVSPADALNDMVTALKPQYRAGARWLMNRNTAGLCQKMKDTEGRWIWSTSLVAGQPSTLLGYPVEIDEDMPDIAANSLSIAFGNVQRAYTVIEKPGIKFLPDPYSAKPHVLLYSYRRVAGGMNNSEALKLMKFSAS